MTSVCLKFVQNGKRWFDGKIINQNFEEVKKETFGYLYDTSLSSDEDSDDETDSDSQIFTFYIPNFYIICESYIVLLYSRCTK